MTSPPPSQPAARGGRRSSLRRRSLRGVLVGSLAAFAAALSILSWQVGTGQDPALRARQALASTSAVPAQQQAAAPAPVTSRSS